MSIEESGIPQIDDDPVLRLLLSGAAATLDEAEELYLDAAKGNHIAPGLLGVREDMHD